MIVELIVFTTCIAFTLSAHTFRHRCIDKRKQEKRIKEECFHECCICLDNMEKEEEYYLECGHSFHEGCIKQWFCKRGHRRCPICDH